MKKYTLLALLLSEKGAHKGSSLARVTAEWLHILKSVSPTHLKLSFTYTSYKFTEISTLFSCYIRGGRKACRFGVEGNYILCLTEGYWNSPEITLRTTNWHFFPRWNSNQFIALTKGDWTGMNQSDTIGRFFHVCVCTSHALYTYIYSNINQQPVLKLGVLSCPDKNKEWPEPHRKLVCKNIWK